MHFQPPIPPPGGPPNPSMDPQGFQAWMNANHGQQWPRFPPFSPPRFPPQPVIRPPPVEQRRQTPEPAPPPLPQTESLLPPPPPPPEPWQPMVYGGVTPEPRGWNRPSLMDMDLEDGEIASPVPDDKRTQQAPPPPPLPPPVQSLAPLESQWVPPVQAPPPEQWQPRRSSQPMDLPPERWAPAEESEEPEYPPQEVEESQKEWGPEWLNDSPLISAPASRPWDPPRTFGSYVPPPGFRPPRPQMEPMGPRSMFPGPPHWGPMPPGPRLKRQRVDYEDVDYSGPPAHQWEQSWEFGQGPPQEFGTPFGFDGPRGPPRFRGPPPQGFW